jgi:hypothetical protein
MDAGTAHRLPLHRAGQAQKNGYVESFNGRLATSA